MSHLVSRRRADDAGYTLVEMLVVTLILGVVSAVFASSLINAIGTERRTRDRADVQSQLIVAMERVTRQVRVAAPLVSVSATQLVVDVFPDQPSGTTLRERYTYTVVAGVLSQRVQAFQPATSSAAVSDSTRVLADGLVGTAPVFTSRDRTGTATTVAGQVASVDVSLVGDRRENDDYTAQTTIYLRNYQG